MKKVTLWMDESNNFIYDDNNTYLAASGIKYEAIKPIKSAGKKDESLQTVDNILKLKKAGFTAEEIQGLLV